MGAMRVVAGLSALVLVTGCADGDDGNGGSATTANPPGAAEAAVPQRPPGTDATAEGVTVTGTGESRVAPDIAIAELGVQVTADTVDAALSRANELASDVVAALQDAGVAEQDIQTVDVSIHERRPEGPRGEPAPAPTGYTARNFVRVQLDDIEGAGTTLQAAMDAAGDEGRLRNLRFATEDPDGALASAREAAFAAAREAAEQYAELSGRSLGELIALSEGREGTPRPAPVTQDAAPDAGAAIPVQPGESRITVTITATWALD